MWKRPALLALVFAVATGCAPRTPPAHVQQARILVTNEAGAPIAGADVLAAGKPLTKTDDAGRALLRVNGREGDVFRITIGCPEGFRAQTALDVDVTVRRTVDDKTPEFDAHCVRVVRTALVLVRAAKGVNLPVLHLGRKIAETDASGAATATLEVTDGEDVELEIDTTTNKKLHPQNPRASFRADPGRDVFVFEPVFVVDKPPPPRIVVAKRPTGPVRLSNE